MKPTPLLPPPTRRRRLFAFAALAAVLLIASPDAGAATAFPVSSLMPDLTHLGGKSVAAQVTAIVLGTLISEDVVCVVVGMLIRKGELSPWVGGAACFLGIYVGDLLFFLIGRLGGTGITKLKFFTRGFGPEKLAAFGAWFDRRPWAAIAMCRILPGVRVPLYLAVGSLTKRTGPFFLWTAIFAFVWTPALIGLVYLLGDAFVAPFEWVTGGKGWIPLLLGCAAMVAVIKLAMMLATAEGRAKLADRVGWMWGRQKGSDEARMTNDETA